MSTYDTFSLRAHPLPLLFSPPPASSQPIPDNLCVLPSLIISILAAPGLLPTISIRLLLVPCLNPAIYILLAPCLHPAIYILLVPCLHPAIYILLAPCLHPVVLFYNGLWWTRRTFFLVILPRRPQLTACSEVPSQLAAHLRTSSTL
jgi:hypothetical protein